MELLGTFQSLPRPARSGSYSVDSTAGPAYRVGRSFTDHPVVLIAFEGSTGLSAPRRLANLSYSPPSSLEIVGADGSARPSRMAILECNSDDPQLAAYFFRVVASVLLDAASTGDEA